jgi:hypothetical protein
LGKVHFIDSAMADQPKVQTDEEVERSDEEVELDISNSDVCTKYREAGKIANLALQGLVLQVKPGAKVLDLCKFGDMVITKKCGTIYQKKVKGKAIDKGVAFPTCENEFFKCIYPTYMSFKCMESSPNDHLVS